MRYPADTPTHGFLRLALAALRPHQWVKNALLPLPLLMAHVLPWHGTVATRQWIQVVGAFAAFCLAASAIYIINDLHDLSADRQHLIKRRRPFASGRLQPSFAMPMVAALLAAAAVLCVMLPPRFALVLVAYLVLSATYTFWLKRKLLVDVFILAGLYTLRLLAGGYAGAVPISKWLLAFSIFFFVSLAFAKRYAELASLADDGRTEALGRNYTTADLRIIESAGPASGYVAVLVLALYVNDSTSAARQLYAEPVFLWLLCPLLMYWLTRVWFVAGRRQLNEDPILFAVKDRVSWAALLVAAVLVIAAWQPWR